MHFITFMVDDQCYAIEAYKVERIVRCAALISLPQTTTHIYGTIDLQGHLVTIFSVRHLLKLPQRDLELSDQFIICQLADQRVGLLVDNVKEMAEYTGENFIESEKTGSSHPLIRYLIKDNERNILAYHWEKICQLADEQSL